MWGAAVLVEWLSPSHKFDLSVTNFIFYNVECFLAEDETNNGLNLGGLVSFADPKSDPYLTNPEIDDDASDIEDFQIKPTDNLLLVGHVESNAAILEVYGEKMFGPL